MVTHASPHSIAKKAISLFLPGKYDEGGKNMPILTESYAED